MKKLICYTMITLLAAVGVLNAALTKEALSAKEKAAWQAFKEKNQDEFKKLISTEFRGVYSDGVYDFQKELDDMKIWDMTSFTISDYNIVPIGTDTAISTYKVVVAGTKEGKDASGTFNSASVWKLEKGTWKAIFHTNIKEEAGATATPAASP